MDDGNGIGSYLRRAARNAGRAYERARRTYAEGADADGDAAADGFDLPTTDDGEARLVCRRYAERRAVEVDATGRPACFDGDHPDCRGCAEDVREGVVETW